MDLKVRTLTEEKRQLSSSLTSARSAAEALELKVAQLEASLAERVRADANVLAEESRRAMEKRLETLLAEQRSTFESEMAQAQCTACLQRPAAATPPNR